MEECDTTVPPTPAPRLRKHADYQRAYAAAARKQHSREMSFFFARRDAIPTRRLHPDETSPGPDGPRIGLTVPKALGKAHDRNRIKRRMRAALALHAPELAGLAVDVILHPRRTVLLLEWDRLQGEVREVLRTVRRGLHAPPSGAPRPAGDKGRARQGKGKPAATSAKPTRQAPAT